MSATSTWKPYLIGVAVTCVLVAAAWVAMVHKSAPKGALDNAYASQVEIQDARVSAAQSMMGGGVVYYNGTLENHGDRTLVAYIVELTFHDVYGKPIQTVRRILLSDQLLPVGPHSSREVEIGFDQFPAGWNQVPPTARPVAVYVR